MTIFSTISDLSTRIRNGQKTRKLNILVKKSNNTKNILDILQGEGYIRGYVVKEKNIEVLLKYLSDKPVISKIESISAYNKNKFISANNLVQLKELTKKSNQGLGLFILSTSS